MVLVVIALLLVAAAAAVLIDAARHAPLVHDRPTVLIGRTADGKLAEVLEFPLSAGWDEDAILTTVNEIAAL